MNEPVQDIAYQKFSAELKRSDPNRAIIVDLDETLWLKNSTEEFLAFANHRRLLHSYLQY